MIYDISENDKKVLEELVEYVIYAEEKHYEECVMNKENVR